MYIVIEASFYCVGIDLYNLWRRKTQIGALSQQFDKMAAPKTDIFIIAIMLLN